MFSDVSSADFNHYFVGTAMVLKLPTNKRRLFLAQALDGSRIEGRYLTREKEWKQRTVAFSSWQDSLDIIPPSAIYFNTQNNAGAWHPSLSSNRKKSFPYNTMNVKFYAPAQAADTLEQEVVSSAFGDLYGESPLPRGEWALESLRPATVTMGHFIVDKSNMAVHYKKALIGKLAKAKGYYCVELFHDKKFFQSFLVDVGGFSPNSIEILPKREKEVPLTANVTAPNTVNVAFDAIFDNEAPPELTLRPAVAPQHLNAGYSLTMVPLAPWSRLNTPPPIPSMRRNNPLYDTAGCQFHVTEAPFTDVRTLLTFTRPMHWAWDSTRGPAQGYRADAYTRYPPEGCRPREWVQPLWGRGYAVMEGTSIKTYRGLLREPHANKWAIWG